AAIGLAVGVVTLQGGTPRSQVDAAGAAGSTDTLPQLPTPGDAAQRLRAAFDATLASESFRVRTVAVVVDGEGEQMVDSQPLSSAMPLTIGSDSYGDTVWSVAGDLVEMTRSDGPARSVRDRAASTTAWEVAPGEWARASIVEDTVVEHIEALAEVTCVTQGDRPDTFVVLVAAGPLGAPCPSNLTADIPRLRWNVTLRPDGRIDRIEPIRDEVGAGDARSAQRFSDYDTATVELPDPASVTEVSTPEGSYIDSATGYARPMYSKG
ncbi:MAG: hypothetical protein ACYC2O_08905, partial [Microthrixaceae bacterium]